MGNPVKVRARITIVTELTLHPQGYNLPETATARQMVHEELKLWKTERDYATEMIEGILADEKGEISLDILQING